MTKHTWRFVSILLLLCASKPTAASSPWGADYFPNVPLVTHEGENVRFFDDLIKDKVVVINFIYTYCPDTCPLETARLTRVHKILGDRVGKDIFMYSISIDPERDTPEVLAEYAERYRIGPGWKFLTGKESDITQLRKKLGLYIDEIQDGSNNHNLNLIIGNQATGRWMKRSPFENPHVLATQIGSWLTDWKAPPVEERDYSDAPKLRSISRGESLYRTRCQTCHSIGGGAKMMVEDGLVGPDLIGVTERRERPWLRRWLEEPDVMLAEKDPIAMDLYARYNGVPMPNMRLSKVDVASLIRYLKVESRRVLKAREAGGAMAAAVDGFARSTAGDRVAIMNAWIREGHPEAMANGGYMTLVNPGSEDLKLVKIESKAYDRVEFHEMAMVDGLMKMRALPELIVPAGGQARFEPGGMHLMLMGPQRHLTAGQKTDMVLTFESGSTQIVSIPVANR